MKKWYIVAKVFQAVGFVATAIALILHFTGKGGIVSQVLYLIGFTVCLTAILTGQALDDELLREEQEKEKDEM